MSTDSRVYRKIYESHHGPIPDGFHIHHKDMVHSNNDPSNLEALHPDDHAQKHGFISNFIMATSTALERSHVSRRTPESRARAAAKSKGNKNSLGHKHSQETKDLISQRKMGQGIGNKYAVGSKGPLGIKRSEANNQANSLRAKAWWANKKVTS